jgi:hypothetical protein
MPTLSDLRREIARLTARRPGLCRLADRPDDVRVVGPAIEYRRLFGVPPGQDTERLQGEVLAAPA